MIKQFHKREEARPPKTIKELEELRQIYEDFEPFGKSPFPNTEKIPKGEEEIPPIIVHNSKGRSRSQK